MTVASGKSVYGAYGTTVFCLGAIELMQSQIPTLLCAGGERGVAGMLRARRGGKKITRKAHLTKIAREHIDTVLVRGAIELAESLPELRASALEASSLGVNRPTDEACRVGGVIAGTYLEAVAQLLEKVVGSVSQDLLDGALSGRGVDDSMRAAVLDELCEASEMQVVNADLSETRTVKPRVAWVAEELAALLDGFDAEEVQVALRRESQILAKQSGRSDSLPEALEQRNVSWLRKATRGALSSDRLKEARVSGRISGRLVGKRWRYPIEEVVREWPEFRFRIEAQIEADRSKSQQVA